MTFEALMLAGAAIVAIIACAVSYFAPDWPDLEPPPRRYRRKQGRR